MKEITYTLSEREYLIANRAHIMHIMTSGSGLIIPLTTGIVIAVMLALELDKFGQWPARIAGPAIAGLTVALALWLLLVAVTLLTLPGRIRPLYQQQRLLREETRARWDADRFETVGDSASSRLPWGDFVRWIETDQALLLFPNDLLMYVLPKRVMGAGVRDDLVARLLAVGSPRWRIGRGLGRPTRKQD